MYWSLLRFGYTFVCLSVLFNASSWAQYAGSESCKTCHSEIYSSYVKSGHPYKLNKVKDAPPSFPNNTSSGVPHPPSGYDWKDISYVIGGFGWKARFMNQHGYILTGENTQYNLANKELKREAHWVAYGGKEASSKPYTCGTCHSTGWVATGNEGPHQDDLPGIQGTWAEPGVTCEACHGPSAGHVASPLTVKPTTKENCGDCHSRGEPTTIDAKGGLVRHHEQYEDLLASPHKSLSCGSCHEPHQSTVYHSGGYKGDSDTCMTCHQNVQIKLEAKKNMACHSCHMPYAVKSAMSTNVNYQGGVLPKGDLRSHIQRISTNIDWNMFTDDGKFVRVDEDNKAYLSLDYVCLSCHTSKDKKWAKSHAESIH